ncbi:MAG: signal transduction histidine kinase [Candidatus Latescibacterota bacterium]|jgi:signal transduction histidine kinase
MTFQTILLLTPSPTIAAIFEATATVLQCRVKHLHTATEAMAYLQTQQVSLVVIDQDISEQSAIALLKDIDCLHTGKRALILNASADMDQIVSALNQAQVSLIFRKPLMDPRMVIKMLRDTLYNASSPPTQPIAQPLVTHLTPTLSVEKTQKLERLYTLGEIANGVIHQFNNVLTIMNGHVELLLNELDDPKLQHRALTILKAGEDGARLTRSIQNFVRTSKNPTQVFNLNDLVKETLEMTEPVWGRSQISTAHPIEIDTQLSTLPLIKGNPGEIREALTNLILNGIDAMPQGGRLSLVTTHDEDTIQLQVIDTGIGMAESVQNHIFEPFFTTKGENGNGLGLGIVSRIVHTHAGTIKVDSQPGKGTCFTLTFQAIRTENKAPETLPAVAMV